MAWFYRSTDLQIRSHVPVSGLGEVELFLTCWQCKFNDCVVRSVQMEVLKSRHRNENPVGAVKAKCHVLSFSQYCRYSYFTAGLNTV